MPIDPPPEAPTHAQGRTRLDRNRIVTAAIQLLDEEGIAELSTRRLAARLGVRSPTLYWHVRDKAELLDLVAEELCADSFDIDAGLPWRNQLEQGLHQFRSLVLAHRDVAALLRDRPPHGPNRRGHIETTVRILLEAGLTVEDAAGVSRLLVSHVLSTHPGDLAPLAEAAGEVGSSDDYPNLRRVAPALAGLSGDALFELGMQVILDGIEARLTAHR
ncbi:TetR/AcrR family transcriptional regulator C-terminal domain-containing protein [Ruania zhangjianzhongii]|uniref:TetR/AcrR family transcriptional regulator C-terminal domain-containing protein n=1 Tax=Ruania zhangjianzhongii TaxID=2603206 RepID=UPI0011CAF63D|nr:TetR/AcrR family transcriptional regulator C-terminal domain-containing protein [Ruania zhangjianzhongii]